MEYKRFNALGMNVEEGVLLLKFIAPICKADENNVLKIKNLFDTHGYNLSIIPGEFIKIFASNEKEIATLEKTLFKIDKLGMKDYFNINLRPASFSEAVVGRIEFCLNNGLPYLNEDNTFIKELYDSEAFAKYSSNIPINRIKTAQEVQKMDNMNALEKQIYNDPEAAQIYNEIIERLNYIVLANPTDESLVNVINNIKSKIIDAIIRKEYRYLTIHEMISNVMFDGLDVSPVDNVRIEELIYQTFGDAKERKLS